MADSVAASPAKRSLEDEKESGAEPATKTARTEPAGAAESSSSTVTATAPTETKPAETKPAEAKPELSAEGTQPIRPHRRS
jgi:hypothetical protein